MAKTKDQSVYTLAKKYNVVIAGNKVEAGCPGIMNPLGETPGVDLAWGYSTRLDDKKSRFVELQKALITLDNFTDSHNVTALKADYLNLTIHGRCMYTYIANKQDSEAKVSLLSGVADLAKQGLDLTEVPFGKGGATIQAIFDKYIKDVVSEYTCETHHEVTTSGVHAEGDAN